MKNRKLISIVVPVFNEEANVEAAYEAIARVFDTLPKYDFEIVFTDNHSEDATFANLTAIAARDKRVRVARFSRNFGFNRSVLTGYRLANGDAAIQLDCDLQDPPEMFSQLLEHWEKGHDVVVGVRRNRKEAWILKLSRKIFYRLLKRFSDDNLVLDGGDFRLVDRSILDMMQVVDDAEPYTRALTSLLASNQIGIPYDRAERVAGESKFPVRRLLGLAMEGFLAHSVAPLRISSFFGVVVAVCTTVVALFYVLLKALGMVEGPAGFTTTTVLILIGISLNAVFLGIIGEYLGRIYNQIRRRPLTIIEASINVPERVRRRLEHVPNWQHWHALEAQSEPEMMNDERKEKTDARARV